MKRILFAHKKLEKDFPYSDYTVIRNDKNTDLDHRIYSEVAGFQLFWEQLKKDMEVTMGDHVTQDDFFSLNHYRRLIDRDCTNRHYIVQPMILPGSVAQHYAYFHNGKDLEASIEAMKQCFPNLVEGYIQTLNGNRFIPYNICVTTAGTLCDYFNYLITVLKKTMEIIGITDYESAIKHVESDPEYTRKLDNRNADVKYQARIPSFIAERLSTFYWLLVSQRVPVFPAKVLLMEKCQTI
ncbi:MAG: DUF4422 domain-containing protein [Bacillus sp. (in: Bacteria)]|nr:DUF4422 domain-containing protein [Bacillus sp. (in: firmicutes)]